MLMSNVTNIHFITKSPRCKDILLYIIHNIVIFFIYFIKFRINLLQIKEKKIELKSPTSETKNLKVHYRLSASCLSYLRLKEQ